MSTEVLNQCGNCMEVELAEIISNDCLDIVDGENITAWDFANYVVYLSKALRVYWLVEDEYKGMKTKEIADLVKSAIQSKLDELKK